MKKSLTVLAGFCMAIITIAAAETKVPDLKPLAADLVALNPTQLLLSDPAGFAFVDTTKGEKPASFAALPDAKRLSYRATVTTRGVKSHDVETKFKTIAPVKKGDVLLARFMARAPVAKQESGEGAIGFAFQLNGPPHEPRSIGITVAPGPEWALYEIPFVSAADHDAGKAVVALSFADLVQTVEISGLELLNFGTRARLDQLPKLQFTYKGREADAPWRAVALKRIEEIRTAPLTIRVTDGKGNPLAGVRVDAKLTRSEFIWGTAVNEEMLAKNLPDSEKYRSILKECFNTAVIENGYKWPSWNSNPEFAENTDLAFGWLKKEGFRQKGHNLVWPGWKFAPKSAKELALKDPAAFKRLIDANIEKKIERTKGAFISWDVINEIMHERDFLAYLPTDEPVQWFRLARKLEPSAKLVLNDYSMLNSAMSPGTITRFIEIAKSMKNAGAPIDELGIQGHVGQQPRAPELILSDLDLVATAGMPVQITEFDVNTKDEAIQADYTRDFLIACYSHPVITGFIQWGFWEPKHWKRDAAMFRPDWSEKPNAAVWREWVLDKWKTHLDTTTSADGTASVRGHFGAYHVTITCDGVVKSEDITLNKDGASYTVKFP
ncbi:MAG: endo-1,4-beta-xylanase [Luteolibacter sp.]